MKRIFVGGVAVDVECVNEVNVFPGYPAKKVTLPFTEPLAMPLEVKPL
jgi:hypothetical protein